MKTSENLECPIFRIFDTLFKLIYELLHTRWPEGGLAAFQCHPQPTNVKPAQDSKPDK